MIHVAHRQNVTGVEVEGSRGDRTCGL